MPDNIDRLYNALKADGLVSKSREFFRGKMLAPGAEGYRNRKQLYDALKGDGLIQSPSYEDFSRNKLGMHATRTLNVEHGTLNVNGSNGSVKAAAAVQRQTRQGQQGQQGRQVRQAKGRSGSLAFDPDFGRQSTGEFFSPAGGRLTHVDGKYDPLGANRRSGEIARGNDPQVRRQAERGNAHARKAVEKGIESSLKRIDDEQLERRRRTGESPMKQVVTDSSLRTDPEEAGKRLQQKFDEVEYMSRTGKELKNPVEIGTEIGENGEVVGTPLFAPTLSRDERGKVVVGENGEPLIGATGDVARTGAYRQTLASRQTPTIDDKIREAEAAEERLLERLKEARDKRQAGLLEAMYGGSYDSSSHATDPDLGGLEAALYKAQRTLQTLRDVRDGKTNSYWRKLWQTVSDPSRMSGGWFDVANDIALMRAQGYIDTINRKRRDGIALSADEQDAETILNAFSRDDVTQSEYQDRYGALSRAGEMTGASLWFMPQFLMSFGLGGKIAGSVARSIANLGTEYFAKKGGESLLKAVPKALARAGLKSTGVLLGTSAGGALIANTTGIGQTAAAVTRQLAGDVTKAGDGEYRVENKEDNVLKAVAEAERSQIRENGSELLGEFIPGGKALSSFAKKGLEKIGLSKLGGALTRMGSKDWYRRYSSFLKTGGYNGIPGEALEEYGGMLFDALTGHAVDAYKDISDPKQHVDIWLGCATMGALMGAVPMANHVGGYYYYRHKMNSADKVAGFRMTQEKWEPLREKIDGTDNSKMADVVVGDILGNKGLSAQEKTAALKYVDALTKFRGFNLADVARADDAVSEERPVSEEQVDSTKKHREGENAAYGKGYETTDASAMNGVRSRLTAAQQRLDDYFEQAGKETWKDYPDMLAQQHDHIDAQTIVGSIDANGEPTYPEDTRQMAQDVVNAQQEYEGMLQRVRDDMDDEVEQTSMLYDQRTNPRTGMIQQATLKAQNPDGTDRKVYVTSGNIVMMDDGQTVDRQKSDMSVVIVDDEGKVEMISPEQIFSLDTPINGEQAKREAVAAIRETRAQDAADKIDGVGAASAQRQTQRVRQEPHQWQVYDTFTATDNEGQPVRGQVTGISADGIEIYTETPLNGRKMQVVTPEQLEQTVTEINGEDRYEQPETNDSDINPKPIGKGIFGNIYDQFKGKVNEAVNFLKRIKSGEAKDVLWHNDIGNISLVWGNESYGLAHILSKHPDVLDGLQDRINEMSVVSNTDNRIVLESATHRAVVSKMLGQEKTPQWLLTAYEKKDAPGGSSDIVPGPQGGKQNGTAPLQGGSSTANLGNNSESGVNNSEKVSSNGFDGSNRSNGSDSVDELVDRARGGDTEAQERLNKYGIPWNSSPNGVHRYVNEEEVNTILNGGTYRGRFGDGRVDVTGSDDVTTAASADYRVNFKPEHDFDKESGRARVKNPELKDGWLEGGYSLDDVQTIEKRNPDGTYGVIYDTDKVSPVSPFDMSDKRKVETGEKLRTGDAVTVTPNTITASEGVSARKAAEAWWEENNPQPLFYTTDIGDVEINKKSVKNSLAHRYSQAKLDSISSLADGFENAVYLGTLPDANRQDGVVDHYFAYPIMYGGKRHYVFCRVMQDANKNSLYVHEVFVADNIKEGDTLQTAASQPHGGISLYKGILANVLYPTNNNELGKPITEFSSSDNSRIYPLQPFNNANLGNNSESGVNNSEKVSSNGFDGSSGFYRQNVHDGFNGQERRAIDRIPSLEVDDGKGDVRQVHQWEQAEPGDTYDALTEIYHGNADRVKKGVENRISAIDKQVRSTQKKMDAIDNSDDFDAVAAQSEQYDALQRQKDALEQQRKYWQSVQGVPMARRAEQDQRTEAEKAAAKAAREKAEAEAAEQARIERERVNGVPDVINDTPSDARKRGFRNVNGMVVERQQPVEGVTGREARVKFSSSDTAKGRVKVIEADQLQPSHVSGQRNPMFFIDEAQPKDRTDAVSSMAAAKIASDLNPEEITGDGSAYQFSSPTVNSRGEVIQGNNRSDALKLMYSSDAFKPAQDAYKQYIVDHAGDFGFTAEDVQKIQQMQKPVMVNELDVNDDEAIRLGQMKASDNESGGIERIDPVTTSQKLGGKVSNYANVLLGTSDEDASLSDVLMQNGAKAVKWLRQQNAISDTAAQSAFDRKGNLTPEARMDLQNILKQSLFQGGVSDLPTMFDKLPAKAQKAILNTFMRDFDSADSERILPEIQKAIEAWYGCANANEAFAKATNYKAAKAAMHDWTLQTNLLDNSMPSDKFSNFAMELACRLQGCSMRESQQNLNDFFDLVQGKSQGDLFGGTTAGEQADRQEAIRRIFNIEYQPINNNVNGENGSNAVADNGSQSGEGRQRGTGDGSGRERAASEGRSDAGGGRTVLPESERRGQGDIQDTSRRQQRGLAEKGEVTLSDEIDENGRQFVLSPSGELAFGHLGEAEGLPSAPILLSEGMITNSATNDGYGLVHIEARHGEQIRNAGYASVVDFIEDVAKHFETIKKGKIRDGHQTYLMQLTDKHNNTLIVELSKDGSYWNINTAGIFKESYGKNREIVYSRHTTANRSTETDGASQGAEQGGTTASSSMNAPSQSNSSAAKLRNKPEKGDKKAEKVDFSIETEEAYLEFERRIPSMGDEELLGYIAQDDPDVTKAYHPALGDEYDDRHYDEERKFYGFYRGQIDSAYAKGGRAAVKSMLDDAWKEWVAGGYASAGERTRLQAQMNAAEDWLQEAADKGHGATSTPDEATMRLRPAEQAEPKYYTVNIGKNGRKQYVEHGYDTTRIINKKEWDEAVANGAAHASDEYVKALEDDQFWHDDFPRRNGGRIPDDVEAIDRAIAEAEEAGLGDMPHTQDLRRLRELTVNRDRHYAALQEGMSDEDAFWNQYYDEQGNRREVVKKAAAAQQQRTEQPLKTGDDVIAEAERRRGFGIDRQGNPVDNEGKLIKTKVSLVDDITDEDFTNPTRTVELPTLPENVDNAIGANGKPVIIKKNIFERNKERHSDITPEESRDILRSALYTPNLYGQNQKATRPHNWVVINTKGKDGKNRLVLLEINSNKDNVEVVHWHYIDARGLEKIRKQAAREDGQLLILPSESSEEAGALSSPTDGNVSLRQAAREGGELLILTPRGAAASLSTLPRSSSEGKGMQSSSKKQEKDKKNNNEGQFGLVSDERMEELKKRLRAKLNNLNMGVDPEIMSIGFELTMGHLDRGVKTFVDFAKAMIADLGEAVRPYLKSFYNGARDLPQVVETGLNEQMDDYETVSKFNVATIGKEGEDVHPSILDTAEQVSNEQTVQRHADVLKHRANAELASRIRAEIEKEREQLREQRAASPSRRGVRDSMQPTRQETILRDTINDVLRGAGIEVIDNIEEGQRVLDMANERGKFISESRKRALETASLSTEPRSLTVVSSADGAKVLKDLGNLVNKLENSPTQPKTFAGSIAKALGIPKEKFKDKSSQYATFETKNDKIVTIRISDHNATTSNLDTNGQDDAISIVITNKPNKGVANDGSAHIVEYYYNAIKLRKADGKPLVEIAKGIKQSLYSGEYTDTTGLAERQEVNVAQGMLLEMRGYRFFRGKNGEAYGFTVGGKMYIDPRVATAETPLHEYTHLWVDAIKKLTPKEWKNIVGLLKGTWSWDYVKKLYPELKTDDEIADEALAHFSGRRGAERARKAMGEAVAQQRSTQQDSKESLMTAAKEGLKRLQEALSKFWENVCDLLHIHFTKAEEVADRVMADCLRGFDPRRVARGGKLRPELNDKQKRDAEEKIDNRLAELQNKKGQSQLVPPTKAGNPQQDAGHNQVAPTAKVGNLFDITKQLAQKIANFIADGELWKDINADNFSKKFIKAIEKDNHNQLSIYVDYGADGERVTLRLSDHRGNARNIILKGKRSSKGISVVIFNSGSDKGVNFKGKNSTKFDVVEYIYDNPSKEVLKKIAKGLFAAVDSGDYIDLAGATEINDTQRYRDRIYETAVKNGDLATARRMLEAAAAEHGYHKPDYQGSDSWSAPVAEVEFSDFDNLQALQQMVEDYGNEANIFGIINGIQGHDSDYYFRPERAGFPEQSAKETAGILRNLRDNGAKADTKVKIYRVIPNAVKGDRIMRGDWVALSKSYCEDLGRSKYGEGQYRVIEDNVPIKYLWQGSEDMREFGYDDGKEDMEKNTSNNRKILELTYDDNGKLIPLSERFNDSNSDIRFDKINKSSKPHKKSTRLAEDYKGFTQEEFDGFKDKHLGKEIEEGSIDKFLSTIKHTSDIEPEMVPYSKENYIKLFGKGIDTPIGHVKMSETQDEKIEGKNRTQYFSLAKPTLESPDFILAKPSNAKDGQRTESPSSYVFVKTFRNADNSYVTYYNAVSVKKDGLEVVQSSYMPYENQVKGSIKGSTLIHLKSVALPSEADTSVQGNQRTNHVGGSSDAKVGIKDEGLVRKSENVENVDNNRRIREQRADDVERTLMGVHNISLEKLLNAIRQGGFANPSMAVIDTRNGVHDKYGEISLIPSSSLIEERTGRNAGTWTGDAYTPRYPQVEQRMSSKGRKQYDKDSSALGAKDPTFRKLWNDIDYGYSMYLEGRGDRSTNAAWFLAATGREIPKVMEQQPYDADYLHRLNAIAARIYGKGRAFDNSVLYNLSGKDLDDAMAVYKDYAKSHEIAPGMSELDRHVHQYEVFAKTAKNKGNEGKAKVFMEKANECRKYGDTKELVMNHLKQMGHYAYGVDQPRPIDRDATFRASKKYIEDNGLEKEYQSWLKGLADRYDEKEYFYTGTDSQGRPRYKENTLANASAWMKKQGRAGAEGVLTGFGGFAAKHMKQLGTREQIRRNKGQLREGAEERERLQNLYFDLSHYISERIDTYAPEAYVDEIADAREPIEFAKRKYGISLPKEYAEKQAELLAGIKSMPTRYFETKFERPVYLSEFETAVVPDDTPLTVTEELERSGLKVLKYKAGDEYSRRDVTMQAAADSDDVLFRLADEDEGSVPEEQPEDVNDTFNERLAELVADPEQKDRILHLGHAGSFLHAGGVADAEIILEYDKLVRKSKESYENNHPFDAEDIKDLPKALNAPIAVFDNTNGLDSGKVILTELKKDGRNFIVVIQTKEQHRKGGIVLEVNDIATLFPKDARGIINWLNTGKATNIDKKKALDFIEALPNHPGTTIRAEELDSAAKVVRDFENPVIKGEKLSREGQGAYTDEELSLVNAPVAKWLGSSTRTRQEPRHFANRERKNMASSAREMAGRLHLDNVEIVDNRSNQSDRRARAKGYYDRSSGKIVINIANHRDVEDALQTLLHEGVAHYGLRQLFGEHFDTFLDNVYKAADMDVRRRITDLALKKYNGDFRTATEEYLASLAEQTDFENMPRGFWQSIKRLFLDMLHAIGFEGYADNGVTLSDNELRYILWRSYENLKEPGRYRSILGEAGDVAKQYELGVGNYAEKDAALQRRTQPEGERATEGVAEERPSLSSVTNEYGKPFVISSKGSIDMGVIDKASGLKEAPIRLSEGEDTVDEEGKHHGYGFLHIDAEHRRQILNAGYNSVVDFVEDIASNYRTIREGNVVANNQTYLLELTDKHNNTLYVELSKDGKYWNVNSAGVFRTGYSTNKKEVYTRPAVGSSSGTRTAGVNHGEENSATVTSGNSPMTSAAKLGNNSDTSANNSEKVEEPKVWGKRDLLSKAEQVSHGIDANLLFRDSIEDDDNTARETYNKWAGSALENLREAWQDSMINVRNLQEAVLKQRHETLEAYEDAYEEENRSHGRSRAESEYFTDNLYKPLLKAVNAVAKAAKVTPGDVTAYMMAKHGLERNEVLARRDADAAWARYFEGRKERFADYERSHPNSGKTVDDFLDKSWDDFYDKYREKDYSGLTSLTGTVNVGDAEAESKRIVADMEGRAAAAMPQPTQPSLIDELWDKVNGCTKWTLKKAKESGIVSKANYEQVRGMFKWYIPLRGWDETTAGDIYDYVAGSGASFSPTLHKAKGRSSQADNPIAYIGSMAVSAIVEGNKNKVKQSFLGFAENHPTNLVTVSEMWYRNYGTDTNPDWREDVPDIPEDATGDEVAAIVEQHEKDMEALAAQGLATRSRGRLNLGVPIKKGEALEHHVEVLVNGKKYVLYINGNPRAAQALNGTRARLASHNSYESRKVASLGRKLAERYTSLSPSFTVSNMFRDVTMAAITTLVKETPAYAVRFRLNVARLGGPARMFTLMRWYNSLGANGLNGVNGLSETRRYFYEFMTGGGETGFTGLRDIDSYKKDMEKMYGRMNQSILNPERLFRGLAEGLEYVNRCIEDMTRFAIYMASRQSGRSVRQSVTDAKNITLNFNRKGSGELGNATYRNLQLFVNPAIQALQNVAKMAREHPVRFSLMTGFIALIGAAMPLATALLWDAFGGGDDGDDDGWNAVDEYWKLPTWQRRNNLVCWIPGTRKFAMMPLAQEFRVFHGFGETMATVLSGRSVENPALELLTQASDLLPLDFAGNGGNMLINLAPTVTQPLLQIGFNMDFTGRPLFRDSEWNKYEPSFQKAYVGTPSWLVKSSEMINELTGGNEHSQGWLERTKAGGELNNPAVVDHLLKGYYGGLYSFLAQLGGAAFTIASGKMPDVREVPIANRVVTAPREQQNGKAKLPDWYYDMKDESDRYQEEWSGYRKDWMAKKPGAKEHVDEMMKSPEFVMQMQVNAYINAINQIRAAQPSVEDPQNEEEAKSKAELAEELQHCLDLLEKIRKTGRALTDEEME